MDQALQSPPIIAIDLGTTNSLVACFRNGQPELIPNTLGGFLTPSAVALDNQGQLLLGQPAHELRHTGQQVLTSFKRYMGTDKKMLLDRKAFSAPELSSLILGTLKADAEHYLGTPVEQAIITVPAYFNDIQRQATIAAAQMAGLQVARLINEPTAAALAYGLGQTEDSCFLVFDLGGGTFDVSIVELFDGVIEVRASTGDNLLGGDDFVQLLVDHFWREKSAAFGHKDGLLPEEVAVALKAAAQRALHQLSSADQTELTFRWKGMAETLLVTQAEFNQWAEGLLLRLRRPLERALRDTRLRPDQIDQIVMVGGATRIPAVRRLITRLFGRFPLTSIQPDEAIVRGAAVQAGLKAKDAALKEVVLTDVCPFSLGVAIQPDKASTELVFSPLLERNMVIPASRMHSYRAVQEGQREIELKIYQGENRLCRDNIHLGDLTVKLPPNNGQLDIEVRFSYNPNGILEIDVHVPASGERYQKVVINNQSVLSPEEIARARQELQALKVHPRDTLLHKTLLLKGERLYTELTGDTREAMGWHLQQFSTALNTQDEHKIQAARKTYEEFLEHLGTIDFWD